MYNKIVWFEGMPLKPQHFQQQQRYFENLLYKNLTINHSYFYGYSELTINTQLLRSGKLAIHSACGFFSDGTPFHIPEVDTPPPPLELAEGSQNTCVFLALPIIQLGQPDTNLEETNNTNHVRYISSHRNIKDTIVGSNQISEIQVAKCVPKLLTQADALNNYTYLALTEVEEVSSDRIITLNKEFIPPCISIHVIHTLKDTIKEIQSILEHRAKMMALRIRNTPPMTTSDVIDFMLLQLLRRYEPLFQFCSNDMQIHPYQIFQWGIQFLSEISCFTEKNNPIKNSLLYGHEKLTETFSALFKNIRESLNVVIQKNSISIPLTQLEYGMWTGEIKNPEFITHSNFILAVYAQIPGEMIRNNFPNHTKIASIEEIQILVNRALQGICLSPMPIAPREIPYHANFVYFQLEKNHPLWRSIALTSGIALHVGGNFPGIKLELWAIRNNHE